MAAARTPLVRLLRKWEIPDCSCPFHRIPCSCEEYQRTGDCQHPPHYPPPCAHVTAIDPDGFPWTTVEWAELLEATDADEYAAPPAPPTPIMAICREDAIEAMALRYPAFHLYHPGDEWRDGVERVGQMLHRGINGRNYRGGLAIEGAPTEGQAA